jgi:hypothetical protein
LAIGAAYETFDRNRSDRSEGVLYDLDSSPGDAHHVETNLDAGSGRRIRRCLAGNTDSTPEPNRSVDLVFTSQKATVFPQLTMRSISPSRRRQLRSRTS